MHIRPVLRVYLLFWIDLYVYHFSLFVRILNWCRLKKSTLGKAFIHLFARYEEEEEEEREEWKTKHDDTNNNKKNTKMKRMIEVGVGFGTRYKRKKRVHSITVTIILHVLFRTKKIPNKKNAFQSFSPCSPCVCSNVVSVFTHTLLKQPFTNGVNVLFEFHWNLKSKNETMLARYCFPSVVVFSFCFLIS